MMRHILSVLILLLVLIGMVYCILAGADAGMQFSNASQCDLKFPKWVGCVLANHENLAGGLIGAFGTILAGMIAWVSVQNQIAVDREIASRSHAEAANSVREEMEDLCALLNEFWRATDFTLSPGISHNARQDRCRFFLMTVEAYQNISLEPLDAALAALPIGKQRTFANVIQYLRLLDRHITTMTSNPENPVDLEQVHMFWIHLSSFEAALAKYDSGLAAVFSARKKASIESRSPAALIRPFVDAHLNPGDMLD